MDEQLYRVETSVAHATRPVSLAEAGFKERRDLQEWVIAHPEMISPTVRIITFEFARWAASDGTANHDRLDVLGLEPDGTLVVVELKRDHAPDTVDMQAIKYAAMASRFTLEYLAEAHANYLSSPDNEVTEDEALEALTTFAPDLASSEDSLRQPRVVLMARDYPPSVTATAVWLTEMGLDITLITFQAYQSADQTLVTVSQLFPVPDIEDFTISPRQAVATKAKEKKKRTQQAAATKRLVEADTVKDGTVFTLTPNGLSDKLRLQVDEWVAQQPARAQATWTNDPQAPLIWGADKKAHSPTGLAKYILSEATGQTRNFQGTLWWSDSDGQNIADLAGGLEGGRAGLYRRFWTELLNSLHLNQSGLTKRQAAPSLNWIDITPTVNGTHYVYAFATQGLRVELYIDSGEEQANTDLLHRLQAHDEQVQADVGLQVHWEELPGKRACRVAVYRDADINDQAAWPLYISWLTETHRHLAASLQLPLSGSHEQ
jgi:hypothetical protein